MAENFDRRQFLALAGVGGAVFASSLAGFAADASAAKEDFFFVQVTDTHWGYSGPANPEAANTLQRAVAAVNALEVVPDFIVFTGDLTHTTDDAKERRRRLAEFRDIVAKLKVKDVRFMPGEHDAALDQGEAYREFFGKVYYTFDHKGVHFIALDNTTDKGAALGDDQLKWLAADLAQLDKAQPIVVLAHRPLYDLHPQWDWATRDGAKALELLKPFANATVFYGHIHHELHQMVDGKAHHAGASTIFPLPPAGSQPRRAPVAWDPAAPFKGLGFRGVGARAGSPELRLSEVPLKA
jgi:3',5'-cyclic AMP phosphodiesterase CpdA